MRKQFETTRPRIPSLPYLPTSLGKGLIDQLTRWLGHVEKRPAYLPIGTHDVTGRVALAFFYLSTHPSRALLSHGQESNPISLELSAPRASIAPWLKQGTLSTYPYLGGGQTPR